MLNAAIWLGAALFYTVSVAPAMISPDMLTLFGKSSAFYSGSVEQILRTRYLYWHTVCAFIALLHLLIEWLYLGRGLPRLWSGLLMVLLTLGFLGSFWLRPKLAKLHRAQHYLNVRPDDREAAAQSFRLWSDVFRALNVLMIGGVAVYFWRATNPPDALRFVSPAKFRG
jgi:uncharacterized protein DUF4149